LIALGRSWSLMEGMASSNDVANGENGLLVMIGGDNEFRGGEGGGNVEEVALKKGPWTTAEDAVLIDYVTKHGEGNWNAVQKNTGLNRCGKSCRLRWANHLRPNLKKGAFSPEEEKLIIDLHSQFGNKWARMAALVCTFFIFFSSQLQKKNLHEYIVSANISNHSKTKAPIKIL